MTRAATVNGLLTGVAHTAPGGTLRASGADTEPTAQASVSSGQDVGTQLPSVP